MVIKLGAAATAQNLCQRKELHLYFPSSLSSISFKEKLPIHTLGQRGNY